MNDWVPIYLSIASREANMPRQKPSFEAAPREMFLQRSCHRWHKLWSEHFSPPSKARNTHQWQNAKLEWEERSVIHLGCVPPYRLDLFGDGGYLLGFGPELVSLLVHHLLQLQHHLSLLPLHAVCKHTQTQNSGQNKPQTKSSPPRKCLIINRISSS